MKPTDYPCLAYPVPASPIFSVDADHRRSQDFQREGAPRGESRGESRISGWEDAPPGMGVWGHSPQKIFEI